MERYNLKEFTKGWIIGNFTPTLLKNDNFEIALKEYEKGDFEKAHFHKLATEWTIISKGKVIMNNIEYSEGDIIVIKPNEITDFQALEHTLTTVVKVPCVLNDKYFVNE